MNAPVLVVLDCNVYFQAFISEEGPANQLLQRAARKEVTLCLSQSVLDELNDVVHRPKLIEKIRSRYFWDRKDH